MYALATNGLGPRASGVHNCAAAVGVQQRQAGNMDVYHHWYGRAQHRCYVRHHELAGGGYLGIFQLRVLVNFGSPEITPNEGEKAQPAGQSSPQGKTRFVAI